ncbi:MAG: ABC transporter ATP-binding protein [Alphaproteobacteria bacterium]|nr:ABC transporter ATP-binding protein [Alphaproteobacteria bacterium]
MPDLLIVEHAAVAYGTARVVEGASLTAAAGDVVALLGANGAGKSTLLKCIAGLLPLVAGRIRFDGKDIGNASARRLVREGLCYVPEGREIIGALTVDENLVLGGYATASATFRRRRDQVLALFPEIAPRTRSPAWQLSGGEQQMLAIGRALMAGPRLLLLDEPSLGLAPLLVRRVFRQLDTLREATGLTVVLVEQNFRLSIQVADSIVLMRRGRTGLQHDAGALRTLASQGGAIETYLGAGIEENREATIQ